MGPFELLEPSPPGWLGREPKGNAWVELHNLIVAADTVHEFGPEARERIARERGVDLTEGFLAERLQFYGLYLRHLLADGDLTGAERGELAHVAATLGLDGEQTAAVHEETFGRVAVEAAADAKLTPDERALLYRLQHAFALSPEVASLAFHHIAAERLRTLLTAVLADGLLTEAEAAELERAADDFGVPIPKDTARARVEGRAYAVLLRAGALPALPPEYAPLAYAPGEVLHYVAEAGFRTVTAHGNLPETLHLQLRPGTLPVGRIAVTSRRLCLWPKAGPYREHAIPDVIEPTWFGDRLLVECRGQTPVLLEGPALAPLKAVLDRMHPAPPSRTPIDVGLTERRAVPARLPLRPRRLPPSRRVPLEAGEDVRLVTRALVHRLDVAVFTASFPPSARRKLDQIQTGALAVGRRPGLHRGQARTVVVTNRRVVLRPSEGRPTSIAHRALRRALRFADGVVLEPEDPRARPTGWFLTELGDPETLYALLVALRAA